jgi:hypothetical protein
VNARSYFVKLEARTGTLLGGVKSYQSSRFETYEQAEDYRDQALEANLAAGRDIASWVCDSMRAPEIKVQS